MPPNFLWISLEDCSPRFGCYGDSVAQTPNIDRLAAQGTRYNRAFCTSAVCSPSRTSLITGFPSTAMAGQHMRTTFQDAAFPELPTPYHAVPPPQVKCFTEFLRTAGYYCSNNGKTDYQFAAPFTAWDANGKPDNVDAIHWRKRLRPDQPFFAVFNLEDSHESRMWKENPPRMEGDQRPLPGTDPATVEVPPFLPDSPAVRATIARFYDNLAHNDAIVGKLLDQLEEDGLLENTFVMLWSDHGEGLPRAKRFLYDSGIRVPLILRWPQRLPAGKVEDRLVSLVDLAPTVMEAAGIPQPVYFEGVSLLSPTFRACVFAHRDRLDGEYDRTRAVRSSRYKLIQNDYPGRERFGFMPYRARHEAMQAIRLAQLQGDDSFDQPCLPEELYDLEADPFEMRNLIHSAELAPVANDLRKELREYRREFDPDRDLGEDQMVARLWPEKKQPVTATPIAAIYSKELLQGQMITDKLEARGPLLLQLDCASEGASIGYRFDDSSAWSIYHRLLRLEPGRYVIRIKAVRYGYVESAARILELFVEA